MDPDDPVGTGVDFVDLLSVRAEVSVVGVAIAIVAAAAQDIGDGARDHRADAETAAAEEAAKKAAAADDIAKDTAENVADPTSALRRINRLIGAALSVIAVGLNRTAILVVNHAGVERAAVRIVATSVAIGVPVAIQLAVA